MNNSYIRIVVEKWANSAVHGQGALEYIIFLAVCSALVVFGAQHFVTMRQAVDNGFASAVERMLQP